MSGPQGPFFCQNFTFDNANHLHLSPTCATLKAKPILSLIHICLPTHSLPPCLRATGLVGPNGWLTAHPHTLETPVRGVYAAGDVLGLFTPTGQPLPKVGFFAHYQAEVVGRNLALQLTGQKPNLRFRGGAAGASMLTGLRRGVFVSLSTYANPCLLYTSRCV